MPDTDLPADHKVGANHPPLEVVLTDEIAPLKERSDALLAGAQKAAITDEETAAKVSLLGRQIAEWITKTDKARLERTLPHREAEKTINVHYNAIIDPLKKAKQKLQQISEAWGAELRRKAEAEQARIAEAARQAKIKADQEAALAALDDDFGAQETAANHVAEAEVLAASAAAPVHVVINSGVGAKTTFTTHKTAKITNLAAAVMYLIETQQDEVTAFVQQKYNALAPKVAELPGAEIIETQKAVFR